MEGACLPRISNEVDTILGLVSLYQNLRDGLLPRKLQQVPVVKVFTVRLFAYYLLYFSRASDSIGFKANRLHRVLVRQYRQHFVEASLIISTDLLLFYNVVNSTKRPAGCRGKRRDTCLQPGSSTSHHSTDRLRELLTSLSVELLTSYRQDVLRDYRVVCHFATDDIRALDAFRCGMYEQCFEMIRPTVVRLWEQTDHFIVPIFGCMTHLMDDSVAALCGACALTTRNGEMFNGYVIQLTVLVCLLVECKLKLRQFEMTSELRLMVLLYRRLTVSCVTDRLLLSLVYRKTVVGIFNRVDSNACETAR
jgi:hypothetical protein